VFQLLIRLRQDLRFQHIPLQFVWTFAINTSGQNKKQFSSIHITKCHNIKQKLNKIIKYLIRCKIWNFRTFLNTWSLLHTCFSSCHYYSVFVTSMRERGLSVTASPAFYVWPSDFETENQVSIVKKPSKITLNINFGLKHYTFFTTFIIL